MNIVRVHPVMRITVISLLVIAVITGCTLTPAKQQPTPTHALVDIMYATDRNLTGDTRLNKFYGEERGEMQYGVARVAISLGKNKPPLPNSDIWNLGSGDRSKSVELVQVEPLTEGLFLDALSDRLQHANQRSALVYTHGYARTFERAARTTAVVAYEVGYEGIPILYSWPSRGSAAAYVADMQTTEWSAPDFYRFLKDLATRNDLDTIHVIAHSMGNQLFLKAFIKLLANPEITQNWKFGEIVLVAPDVDRAIFERDIAPVLARSPSRITLYVSSVDIPLMASKSLNLYSRVGDARIEPVIVEGIDTIDASDAATLLHGHAYFRETEQVLADLHYLLHERLGVTARPTLEPVNSGAGLFWKIKKTE